MRRGRVSDFDIIVVGGGHAGTEAAAAAARLGARSRWSASSRDQIGAMSCNPAIGGLGKGHLVREVDAFDGLIAARRRRAAIHYRMLNASKGAAVRGPRVQADRKRYKAAIQRWSRRSTGLTSIEGEAAALVPGRAAGRRRRAWPTAASSPRKAVVLATGTFLGGKLHFGDDAAAPAAGSASAPRPRSRISSARSACRWPGSRPARRRGSTAARSTGPGSSGSRRTTAPGRCRR